MEADAKTTRGLIGDAEARTTLGLIGGAIMGVFYTIINAGERLILPVGTVKRYLSAATGIKEYIEAKFSVRGG